MVINRIDSRLTKSRFAPNQTAPAFLTIRRPALGGDFSGGDHGQQSPDGVATFRCHPSLGEATAEAMEGTVRSVIFVVPPAGLGIEMLPRKLLQPHRNVTPQLFRCLLIPLCQLVNPACY